MPGPWIEVPHSRQVGCGRRSPQPAHRQSSAWKLSTSEHAGHSLASLRHGRPPATQTTSGADSGACTPC